MYLVDTNVWLEVLFAQPRSEEALTFLSTVEVKHLFITDFSIHSIGVLALRHKKPQLFEQFISDMLEDSAIPVVTLNHSDLRQVIEVANDHKLDFDDAYVYAAAAKFHLTLVTFDSDFTHRKLGCKTPAQILDERRQQDTATDQSD
jgi:uncharacterized protein